METPENKLKFIRLSRQDENCRCCGRGTQHICDKCYSRLKQGYAFFIEVKDNATEHKKKPTGYAIAFKADQVTDPETGEPLKPSISFIRHSDLKQFLGDAYNNYRTRGADKAKLLSDVRKLTYRGETHAKPAEDPRQAAELVHHSEE